jgi:hypothetical protein
MAQIRWAALDLFGSYRSVFDTMVPRLLICLIVVKLAIFVLGETS